jgi:hypothetical protein
MRLWLGMPGGRPLGLRPLSVLGLEGELGLNGRGLEGGGANIGFEDVIINMGQFMVASIPVE